MLQVKGYLLSFSRAMSALWGSLNSFSTSLFCTDVSNALSSCNPRYTLYEDGRDDLLEMIAHSEHINTCPGHRPLMIMLGTYFFKIRKESQLWSKLVFVIPYHGMWNQSLLCALAGDSSTQHSLVFSQNCFNEWWIVSAQFLTVQTESRDNSGWLLGRFYFSYYFLSCVRKCCCNLWQILTFLSSEQQ